MSRIFFHVDVNSAFLSWSAIKHLRDGEDVDLRTIPAVVGGDEAQRHGVVLAKSGPAKKYGIKTGESLFAARTKYPGIKVVPPDFDFYVQKSKAMIAILQDYTPDVEQYSIDEAFLDMTGTEQLFGPPLTVAHAIRQRIYRELGFTVNVGVAPNRLLAKMASDFEKPDKVHTLFPEEVPAKMWPLPVGDLFGVGPSAARRLNAWGVYTIGELAAMDRDTAVRLFGTRGDTLWNYANGREADPLTKQRARDNSYGNSVTMPKDLEKPEQADATMLALCDSVGRRLRRDGKTSIFSSISRPTQRAGILLKTPIVFSPSPCHFCIRFRIIVYICFLYVTIYPIRTFDISLIISTLFDSIYSNSTIFDKLFQL